ncbi:hypothetical protein B296_00037757 [Ensete ventricosum]|uniref:Uncharacterized protein n=1 Tax=Ensete ventricosum TaxID=4639 RepID=A0A426YP73_ENSVE|nr:hypothetical protein B296_00037757 [Ensete ventricosum]
MCGCHFDGGEGSPHTHSAVGGRGGSLFSALAPLMFILPLLEWEWLLKPEHRVGSSWSWPNNGLGRQSWALRRLGWRWQTLNMRWLVMSLRVSND